MTPGMSIELAWLPPFQGNKEVGRTSATIQIRFGAEIATRFEDEFSKSVQERARASAYPLAMWLASSWWRLRWEPLPSRIRLSEDEFPADTNWRMSHELPAAGYGFIWPQLTFASDGESIHVNCRRSLALSEEPVRYLSDFDVAVAARDFERGIDEFMDLVLRRLDTFGETETELHLLWREVLAERDDPEQSAARKMEARLGYEADEAPPGLLERLIRLAAVAGAGAADEIAPVCAGSDPEGALEVVERLAREPGIPGRISIPEHANIPNGTVPPWERARLLATAVRKSLDLGIKPVEDDILSDLLEISKANLTTPLSVLAPPLVPALPSVPALMGLAVRTGNGQNLKLLFRKRNRPARRFEAARFIADYLSADASDRWLPITDAATARQKLQRAFAAEFLCPVDSLRLYLGNEFLPEKFEEAAEYFGISEMAIKSHLANNGLIPRDLVDADRIS
jgi:hypothetical protein